MKQGYLSQYFIGVAAKTLSAVEVNGATSHQHEFNGVTELKKLFGENRRDRISTKFVYLSDNDDEPTIGSGYLTWYDARDKHPTRTEFRLYFSTTLASMCAAENDTLFIGLTVDGSALAIITEAGSTIGNQLRWLFGIGSLAHPGFSVREELETEQDRIAFASRAILEQLGIEVKERDDAFLEEMLVKFHGKFPQTKEFSTYARSVLKDVDPLEDSDAVLVAWMEKEEILFRTLEKHLIQEQLRRGFSDDVDSFIKYSLSIQNRRKSRVGHALENHIEQIFLAHSIRFDRAKITENNSRPDFIFPGIKEYQNSHFEHGALTMLGVKTTCKDRWRQVLSEAARINQKHLFTLEPSISENQTNQMASHNLQLVIPQGIHSTYTATQQQQLISLETFIELVKSRQR